MKVGKPLTNIQKERDMNLSPFNRLGILLIARLVKIVSFALEAVFKIPIFQIVGITA